MAKQEYLPNGDQERAFWLTNFSTKLALHAPVLGVSAADVLSIQADALLFNFSVQQKIAFKTHTEDVTAWKDLLRDGSPTVVTLPAFPALPALPAVPALVQPGIFKRVRRLVAEIKAKRAYTPSMGEDMGIEGAESVIDPSTIQPTLKVEIKAGKPNIIWVKGPSQAIKIYVDRHDGAGFKFLATDTQPDYIAPFRAGCACG